MAPMSATILVVEDDADVAESVRDVLVGAGYLVPEIARSGQRALELAARLRFSLVLMDVQLEGDLDGIETARRLREAHGIRVVYLTGFADDTTLPRAKQTAPLGYLKKPFNPRELRVAVELALHQASLEGELAAREQWFSTTLQSIGDAVLTTDAQDRVTFLNRAGEALLNVRASTSVGQKVDELVRLVDLRGSPLPLVKGGLGGGAAAGPATGMGTKAATAPLPRDARLVVVGTAEPGCDAPIATHVLIEGSIAPITLDAGKALGSVMVFRDVGERRQLERRLGINERLAAIGTMAAGMQHEINNPLATVVANVQFVLDALRASPEGVSREALAELVSALDDASEGAERVRRTVEDLRHFSRGAEEIELPIDVTSAIEDALRMTAHAVRHHATVRREYGVTPRVRAEEGQLARVFMNLLLNAAQSTGDGRAESHTIVLTTRTDATGRAVAEVTDDGPGIAPEMLHRIFDPFFTTPLDSVTMGLGLAVCHSIVTSLGGEIDVESVLGKGSTFRVSLPPADAATTAHAAPAITTPAGAPTRFARRRGRVLVIDDEAAIGKAIRRILAPDHDVTLETDARVAFGRLSGETFDVIFCDLMMPNMSGMEFFEQVSASSPPLVERIVFLTGGAFSPRSEAFLRQNRTRCLSKPFSREAVTAAVQRLMNASPASPALDTARR
jgi:signal transduction histidine kinase/DNA-binding response OmpR family regulator